MASGEATSQLAARLLALLRHLDTAFWPTCSTARSLRRSRKAVEKQPANHSSLKDQRITVQIDKYVRLVLLETMGYIMCFYT